MTLLWWRLFDRKLSHTNLPWHHYSEPKFSSHSSVVLIHLQLTILVRYEVDSHAWCIDFPHATAIPCPPHWVLRNTTRFYDQTSSFNEEVITPALHPYKTYPALLIWVIHNGHTVRTSATGTCGNKKRNKSLASPSWVHTHMHMCGCDDKGSLMDGWLHWEITWRRCFCLLSLAAVKTWMGTESRDTLTFLSDNLLCVLHCAQSHVCVYSHVWASPYLQEWL